MTNLRQLLFLLVLLTTALSCQKNKLSDLKDVLYVRRNQADMPAYIYGNGQSKTFLIILHGGPGGSGLEYRIGQYKDDLESEYAVVYWDQRGQGMAQGSYKEEDLKVAEIIEDVRALALTLRHKYGEDIDLFLLGHSWGGLLGTAVMTTKDYQNLFQGWIEVAGAHDFPELYRQSIKGYQDIGTQQLSLRNDEEFWEGALERVAEADSININFDDFSYMNITARTVEEKLTTRGIINASDPLAISNNFINSVFINTRSIVNPSGNRTNTILFENELLNYSLTDQLPQIQIPSLILWGRYDLVVPVELGIQAFNLIGTTQKELVIYEQSGHSPMVTEPDAFAQDIITFINTYR